MIAFLASAPITVPKVRLSDEGGRDIRIAKETVSKERRKRRLFGCLRNEAPLRRVNPSGSPVLTGVYFAAGAGWVSLVGGTIPFRRK
jgi:hypothetical protein